MSTILCCVEDCLTRIKDGVILYRFPKPNHEVERCQAWIECIGGDITTMEQFSVYRNRRVCHKHFDPIYIDKYNLLTKDAVPTLHLPVTKKKERPQGRKLKRKIHKRKMAPYLSYIATERARKIAKDSTRALIEAVRKHRCLYDKSDYYYRSRAYSVEAWRYIANELRGVFEGDVNKLKTRWSGLKAFYKEIQMYKETHDPLLPIPKQYMDWPWAPYLTFLEPVVKTGMPVIVKDKTDICRTHAMENYYFVSQDILEECSDSYDSHTKAEVGSPKVAVKIEEEMEVQDEVKIKCDAEVKFKDENEEIIEDKEKIEDEDEIKVKIEDEVEIKVKIEDEIDIEDERIICSASIGNEYSE